MKSDLGAENRLKISNNRIMVDRIQALKTSSFCSNLKEAHGGLLFQDDARSRRDV